MSNVLTSLTTAGNALGVYQQALDVIQNNITNANTPGFASQSLNLEAQPFDVAGGLVGGVAARGLQSARDEFADADVRRQLMELGKYETQTTGTSSIENLFDVTGKSGIPADLTALFQSFSAWSVDPNSSSARQAVISDAGSVANDIHQLAASLAGVSNSIQSQIGTTVDQINQLSTNIQQYNIQKLQNPTDPGLDANLHNALEQLSELADITTVTQADGTVSVLLSGGSPLVVEDQQFAIGSDLALPPGAVNLQAPPSSRITDAAGKDITGQIQGGKLAGLLDTHNSVIGNLLGDGTRPGTLNTFAAGLADTINGILQSGTVSTDPSAASGSPLFDYDNSDPTIAASTFALHAGIAPGDLAAADSLGNSNGNALMLASLASTTDHGGIVNGSAGKITFGDFFGQIVSTVGQASASAQQNQQSQQQVVAQSRTMRDQISGVSLDAQAVLLMQFQKNYQAAARMLTTLNDMLDTVINLIHQ